jgi:putative transcriptional regulator
VSAVDAIIFGVQSDVAVEAGSLLVAAPGLTDANFRRTVVYVIDHQHEGTLGVVLNRPSEISVIDVLPGWGPYSTRPRAIFVGGPVEQKTALCLGVLRTGLVPALAAGTRSVNGPVVLVDLDTEPAPLAGVVKGLRIFAGYSGWTTGQLADEIDRGDWIVVPALPADVVAPGDQDLWGRVLRRQGMPLALLATHPIDLSVN